MTSKLKCPVCNHKLYQTASEPATYCCLYKDCQSDFKFAGSKEIWQALIQSQKDLKTTLTAIKEIAEECGCLMAALKSTGFESVVETFDKNIKKKLKQIEHKE